MNDLDKLFPSFIGQRHLKSKLAFFLSNYKTTQIFPNLLICGGKGNGKSRIISELAPLLTMSNGKPKQLLRINSASVKSLSHFFDSVVLTHLIDSYATVFFDEAHTLPNSLVMGLLTILEGSPTNVTEFTYNNQSIRFDFRKLTFIFATSEPQGIPDPAKDRLHRINLDTYSTEELKEIVRINLKNIKIEDSVLTDISRFFRANPRHATQLSNDVGDYLKANGKKTLSMTDWTYVRKSLNLFEFGLTEQEVEIMTILRKNGKCSLSHLAATSGISGDAIRKDGEILLLRRNLIKVEERGRVLTPDGFNYLKRLETENIS